MSMERIDRILNNEIFRGNLEKNRMAEAKREFCHHDMVHFLDVARIGVIINLEEGFHIQKDLIYACGLLHDIGKHEQYETGIRHEITSAQIAPKILEQCGFDQEETGLIVAAILSHRDSLVSKEKNLRGLLYRADKASRACFACQAEADCNWQDVKKNLSIRY